MINPEDIVLNPETRGWHRFIAHQTTVVPTRVYFEGARGTDRSNATLVIEMKRADLRPEFMRYPPTRDPNDERSRAERAAEAFPLRRDEEITEEMMNAKLDEFVFVPFRLELIDG